MVKQKMVERMIKILCKQNIDVINILIALEKFIFNTYFKHACGNFSQPLNKFRLINIMPKRSEGNLIHFNPFNL